MEFEAPDWKALHSSLARRKRFSFCPVGYYLYHVPGRDGYAGSMEDWQYKVYAAKHCISGGSFAVALWRRAVREYFTPGANFRKRKLENFFRTAFEHDFSLLESAAYKRDPKIVPQVFELSENIYSGEYFYNTALLTLNNIYNSFVKNDLYLELLKTPLLDFRNNDLLWQWQLGGVIFSNAPDLVWKENNTLQILDMNTYAFPQDRSRAAMLYRVYVLRFMGIAPEQVTVNFFDPLSCSWLEDRNGDAEDFTTVFRQLSGEAAMWRDYLLLQHRDAPQGIWHYPRKDNCSKCKFKSLCPALSGTPLPECYSI